MEEVFNFENDLYPLVLKKGLDFFAYHTEEFMADMGTFERLKKCEDYLKSKSDGDNMNIQALILVGGTGTRLRPFKQTVPKPMVPAWTTASMVTAFSTPA